MRSLAVEHDGTRGTPEQSASWVSSLVVHLVLLGLLALFVVPAPNEPREDLLVTSLGDSASIELAAPLELFNEPQSDSLAEGGSEVLFLVATPAIAEAEISWESTAPLDLSALAQLSTSALSSEVAGWSVRQGGAGTGDGSSVQGKGTGTGFFGLSQEGFRKVVFVVDASGSMRLPHAGPGGTRFRRVQWELIETIERLQPNQQFFVVFFNSQAWPMPARGPVAATEVQKKTYANWLARVDAAGRTEPEAAMRLALSFRPDAIYFLTDGQFDRRVVPMVTQLNQGRAVIHTIGFGDDIGAPLLERIAAANGGRYRFIPDDEQTGP